MFPTASSMPGPRRIRWTATSANSPRKAGRSRRSSPRSTSGSSRSSTPRSPPASTSPCPRRPRLSMPCSRNRPARRSSGTGVSMAEVTYLEALRDGLAEELARDERVFVLGEDVGDYGGAFKVTEGFVKRFGAERGIDTPIAETPLVGAAAGAAHMGLRPVCEMQFIDFISCAYSILTNYVATARYRAGLSTPMVVRGPSGGYVRGGPFHSQMPEAAFLHTPGLKIVAPATARDAKGLIKAAIRDDDPVLYFEHKYLYRRIKEQLPEGEEILTPIGKAAVVREGRDLSILTWSAMVWKP